MGTGAMYCHEDPSFFVAMHDTEISSPKDSIWLHKPWWCQPWSILLTGTAGIGVSWIWLQIWWITALVSAAVLAWWGLFLVLVPRAWRTATQDGHPMA